MELNLSVQQKLVSRLSVVLRRRIPSTTTCYIIAKSFVFSLIHDGWSDAFSKHHKVTAGDLVQAMGVLGIDRYLAREICSSFKKYGWSATKSQYPRFFQGVVK